MEQLINKFKQSNIDILFLRLAVITIFVTFGALKWFDFEVEALKPLIGKSWLSFLYDWFGYQGTSYLLGVIETTTYIALIIGIFKPKFGIIGALGVLGTAITTVSLIPQIGFDGFVFKDILLIAIALVLLKTDLKRIYPTK
ncbi:putative membrane protein YkgB [Bisgaardia hudsonensis]|uniref:Putative membrane protein YkgB n=1 Tax=Bisgaardia hudsonensis TaxID=109472 RepID=A0A4V2SIY6_9PAST|nr:DUF417 family protein [Bisgaardia hudsonensis]QLB13667.1 hypothetical protein A6A11_08620 [Bisgaardia hudsonensis]TCP12000.1 putative membrane protein YkgB [Bisgaardia hudsonensis]